ncbi:MAG TPA: hypothetical protein VGM81_19510, partial [Burkholderiaceae bacterium]
EIAAIWRTAMTYSPANTLSRRVRYAAVLAGTLVLAGCQGMGNPFESAPPPAAAPVGRPSIAPSDIIGRWGIASYHREQDRARTEVAARNQCKQPYLISGGQAGGVMMLGHDSPNIVEHLIKATADNRTYLGPGAEPGGADDREVLSFDGRVLVLKWVDPEVQGRYGIMVLVRCGAEGTAPPPRRAATRAAAPPPVMAPPPAR